MGILGREASPADLAARVAIQDVVAKYFMALDRRDWEQVSECLHSDATARYDDQEIGPGIERIMQYLRAGSHSSLHDGSTTIASAHSSGSQAISVQGNIGRVETYATANLFRARGTEPAHQALVRGIRYLDEVERRDGVWKIARRVHVADWMYSVDTVDFAVHRERRAWWSTTGVLEPPTEG
jgi:hypothetical protein